MRLSPMFPSLQQVVACHVTTELACIYWITHPAMTEDTEMSTIQITLANRTFEISPVYFSQVDFDYFHELEFVHASMFQDVNHAVFCTISDLDTFAVIDRALDRLHPVDADDPLRFVTIQLLGNQLQTIYAGSNLSTAVERAIKIVFMDRVMDSGAAKINITLHETFMQTYDQQ